jgi:hypothetical protein
MHGSVTTILVGMRFDQRRIKPVTSVVTHVVSVMRVDITRRVATPRVIDTAWLGDKLDIATTR